MKKLIFNFFHILKRETNCSIQTQLALNTTKYQRFKILKYLIILLIIFSSYQISWAQFSYEWLDHLRNKHLFFANGNVMTGQDVGGGLGFSFVYNEKFSLQAGFSATSSDFNTPVTDLTKSVDQTKSSEIMENYNVMFGRYIYLNSNQTIRVVLQGGPGLSRFVRSSGPGSQIGNKPTKTQITNDNYFSVVFNTRFEFPITQVLGFAAGPTLIVNSKNTYVGIAVGVITGILTSN